MFLQRVGSLWGKLRGYASFWLFRITSLLSGPVAPFIVESPSKLFDNRDLANLKGYTRRMMSADLSLFQRLADRRTQGIRSWEYGQLLSLLGARSLSREWLVLDVGPGNSTFPLVLSSQVRQIVTIDYPHPLERPSLESIRAWRKAGIWSTQGTMLSLPFPSSLFDLVTCISTIEHLDDHGTGEQVPYDKFVSLTKDGLREMARVICPGGFLYLTTDAYIPRLQGIDTWSAKRRGSDIWSAYKIADIVPVFVTTLVNTGFELIGGGKYDKQLLIQDAVYSNYRGRFFTTFCIFAQRVE